MMKLGTLLPVLFTALLGAACGSPNAVETPDYQEQPTAATGGEDPSPAGQAGAPSTSDAGAPTAGTGGTGPSGTGGASGGQPGASAGSSSAAGSSQVETGGTAGQAPTPMAGVGGQAGAAGAAPMPTAGAPSEPECASTAPSSAAVTNCGDDEACGEASAECTTCRAVARTGDKAVLLSAEDRCENEMPCEEDPRFRTAMVVGVPVGFCSRVTVGSDDGAELVSFSVEGEGCGISEFACRVVTSVAPKEERVIVRATGAGWVRTETAPVAADGSCPLDCGA